MRLLKKKDLKIVVEKKNLLRYIYAYNK